MSIPELSARGWKRIEEGCGNKKKTVEEIEEPMTKVLQGDGIYNMQCEKDHNNDTIYTTQK